MTSWSALAGPEAKLDRAIEQLKTLKAQADRFVETQPYTVTVQFEPEAGCYVTRFWGRRPVPLESSILVGEIVHNLRSALEHVAWLLATANANDPASLWEPEKRKLITFPVAKHAEAFLSHSLRPLISAEAKAAIEPLQPYVGRLPKHVATHPLVGLHELWNIDKHRVIHGGIGQFDFSKVAWQPKAITKEDLDALAEGFDTEIVPREGPLKDGAEIAYVRFRALTHPPGTVKVDMEGDLSTRIIFGAGGHAISIDGLEGCCTYVGLVLNAVWPILRG